MKSRVFSAIMSGLLVWMASAASVPAQGNAGDYLAARAASIGNDFEASADYYTRALMRDPGNPVLLESALTSHVALGQFDRALPIARRMDDGELSSQIANLVLSADAARREAWQELIDRIEAGKSVGPLFDGLVAAWAEVGLGRMGAAIERFDAIGDSAGLQAFSLFHKALALGAVGDFEGADRILSGENGPAPRLTRRGVMLHAKMLAQLDRHEDAVALIEQTWTVLDAELAAFRDALAAGETGAYDGVTSAREGIAEVNYTIANAVTGEASDAYTLLFSRMTETLRPDHIDALMLSAMMLERLELFDLATDVYDRVPADHPAFHLAELGRAEALDRAGKSDAAIEVLDRLTESHADLPTVHVTLGDTLRRLERYDEAIASYDEAVRLLDEPQVTHWPVFFARGISHERSDNWAAAEADFRTALEMQPDQPQVLNYLGYSLVEKQTNLDEALDMIERAVAAEPESGYITDSLGWVLYRLGRYDEAVVHMERAVELMPVDPVINDHLGDVYWAVGRHREAEFQWHRALSFIESDKDTDADPARIRRKLEVGLDVVLAEEGAPPLDVANDGG